MVIETKVVTFKMLVKLATGFFVCATAISGFKEYESVVTGKGSFINDVTNL